MKSPAEKERMRKKGMELLKKYGPEDDPQSYCAFGRAEIQKKKRNRRAIEGEISHD
ncbi:DUF5333 family protein [Jhaorihella thermophila]